MDKHLHIVTLDVPYPADYGGAIEQFYKIKWLHQLGVKIHLHCFTKARLPSPELERYCVSVSYYPRKTGLKGFSLSLPYIVASRNSATLLKNLKQDEHPVLLEGVHTTYFLQNKQLGNRKVFVRLHNVEHHYYHQLASHENNLFNKLYYNWESFLLKKYETALAKNNTLLALSKSDKAVFEKKLKAGHVIFLPAFVGWEEVSSPVGKGCYCLYHGNLSINENEEAAIWLLQNVFDKLPIPLVIAGKSPSQRLEHIAHQHEHICLVANPGEKEMQDIIAKAQVNILPSFNNTGVKLKLLNSLYSGRHCLVNKAGVAGSGLESVCVLAEDAGAFKTAITDLYQQRFDEEALEERRTLLAGLNNNKKNAEKLVQLIWNS